MSITISINLEDVASQIRRAASESINEEDLKIRIESILRSLVLDPLNIPWGRYEYHLISGVRPDALHAHVIIEYEKPNTFQQKKDYEHAIQQLKNYIIGHAQGIKDRLPRYFGVALDGYRIGFVRYRQRLNDFEVSKEPLEVNRSTVARLIEAIIGLRRKALDAEELLKDFGPDSEVARRLIRGLYNKLEGRVSARTEVLFNDWKRVFSQVCAYSVDKLMGLEGQYGFEKGRADVEKLLFSLHTYFALLMKLLAAEVASLYLPIMIPSYLKTLEEAYYKGHERLREELRVLEEGGVFSKPPLLIINFVEGDYFGWYLDEWDSTLADSLALMIRKLSEYDPSTAELEPGRVKDLFKRIYQNLVPKKIRHDLGEYYTPDWLAELVLNEVGFNLDNFNKLADERSDVFAPLDLRLLDPACGSGTFLVLALRRLKEYIEEHWIDRGLALRKIVKNVVGFDLNPLAVMASRTNYLITIGDMLREKGLEEEIEIPIYLADSIMVEQRITVLGTNVYLLRTVSGDFEIPIGIVEKGVLSKVLRIMEEYVKTNYTAKEFIGRLEREVDVKEDEIETLKNLYETILKLEKEGKNKIWLRILKNAFAPFLVRRFNYVVGNPPWVNWENLAEEFRRQLKDLYKHYDILPSNPNAQTKVDLSMIFTYRCIDRYLDDGGDFGFLINDAAFKAMAGNGFRKFRIKEIPFKVRIIHDLVAIKPFEGASNRTAMFVAKKGDKTVFPILYRKWFKLREERIPQDTSLDEALKLVKILTLYAEPLGGYKSYGEVMPLFTLSHKELFSKLNRIIGRSSYDAHEGANLLPAGVFRVKVLGVSGNMVLIENLAEKAKRQKVDRIQKFIEKDLVFPMLESANVTKWKVLSESYCIIPHDLKTSRVFSISQLKIQYPRAYAYFTEFEDQLKQRADYKSYGKNRLPYYFVYRFNEHTVSPFKVLWNRMGNELAAAVVTPITDSYLGNKVVIPEDVLAFIPTDSEDEAHYICAILNSTLVNLILQSIAKGGKNFATPEFINNINIKRYDKLDPTHVVLVELSKKAHQLTQQNQMDELRKVEDEIDKNVAKLYGITDEELKDIKKALKLLEGEEIEEEEAEELPSLEPDITIENPVLEEGKSIELELLINNPLESDIKNLKVKVELLGKKHEELIEILRGEQRLKLPLGELKKGEYKVKLSMRYELKGSSKKVEKEVSLFVKEKEAKKVVDRGRIEELFGE